MGNLKLQSLPITKTESLEALKRSRTSLELIRNILDESMNEAKVESKFTTKNTILNSERDRYGFKKANHYIDRETYDEWWSQYSKYLIKRKKKWVKLMAKNGLYNDTSADGNGNGGGVDGSGAEKEFVPVRFPPRSDDLRRFVRKGIPSEWRGNAWFYFAKGHIKLSENKGVRIYIVRFLRTSISITPKTTKKVHCWARLEEC
ncbi:unnamed protein product [Ambrosiozyma monospora]|uniref:Unnamed protein product n=1 Tax=Ambrosiozyma monospora TaxID=43982 RepID=A0ACB5UCB3_AMBMO|nr:unnamed protein product [Ambrosiozyma monospora]